MAEISEIDAIFVFFFMETPHFDFIFGFYVKF
jgi:hypothetical protein